MNRNINFDEEAKSRFRSTLRQKRKELRLSQAKVADKLNIDRTTYAYYESGRCVPNIKVINDIGKVLDIPISTLINTILNEDVVNEPSISKTSKRKNKDNGILFSDLTKQEKEVIVAYRIALSSTKKEIKKLLMIL